ncbi:MAG: tetratricopeptide repeat protein [Rhizobium sp.]|nr:tetratricopeptide repeat protein [Rhizobium sp.]
MPYLGIGLHVIVAVLFAIHAVRNGQPMYWLLILFMFPLLGSVVYGVAVWLPEFRHSRSARRATSAVRRLIDPDRELREATDAHAQAATVQNQLRLADALFAKGRALEALPLYRSASSGLYANDPDIQARLAHALLEAGEATAARELLDRLIAANPDYRSPQAHLTYARAVAAQGDHAKAREEFDVLVNYFPGLEASARYAQCLRDWGEAEAGAALVEKALARARRLPAHSRDLDREWIARLQKLSRVA